MYLPWFKKRFLSLIEPSFFENFILTFQMTFWFIFLTLHSWFISRSIMHSYKAVFLLIIPNNILFIQMSFSRRRMFFILKGFPLKRWRGSQSINGNFFLLDILLKFISSLFQRYLILRIALFLFSVFWLVFHRFVHSLLHFSIIFF